MYWKPLVIWITLFAMYLIGYYVGYRRGRGCG